MAPQTEFSPELLSQPPAARLAYFRDKVVAHPHLKETHQQLWQAIQQPGGVSLIFVFGPTGVGKTTPAAGWSNSCGKQGDRRLSRIQDMCLWLAWRLP